MKFIKLYTQILCTSLIIVLIGCDQPDTTPEPSGETGVTLSLIKEWVHGKYDNVAQAEADMTADLPPELMHRPMHQLFVPLEAPNLEGHIVFQQSSMDGSESPDMIFRHGLMQYLPDENTGAVRQRELYFREDAGRYKNLHRNPELLADVTLEQLTWDEGCDFFLRANESRSMVSGPLKQGACVLFNQGLQKNMYADDRVEITPTEYAFQGRYVDEEGKVVWGTESNELNRMVRSRD
jgi:hypothetical protein